MAERLGKNAATKSLQHYFSSLMVAIQDPVLAASELYSLKLVPLPIFEKMLTLGVSRCEKNGQLLSAIHSQLATNPSEIEVLIQILNVKLNLQDIAKGMEDKYQGEWLTSSLAPRPYPSFFNARARKKNGKAWLILLT